MEKTFYTPNINQAEKNKQYEKNTGLIDKNHFGINGFKSFMDKFAENLKTMNTTPESNPNIYIIADSTIDYYPDNANEITFKYAEKRHTVLKDIFLRHNLIKKNENIYIDAVGGSGYISELSENGISIEPIFFTNMCKLYEEIQEKLNGDIDKFIELLNYLLVNEIIIISRDYYLSRIFTHFFCRTPTNKPKYTNIICFGFGNDIGYFTDTYTQTDEYKKSYNQKNLLLFMQIFWKLADIIISKYNYNEIEKQLELQPVL